MFAASIYIKMYISRFLCQRKASGLLGFKLLVFVIIVIYVSIDYFTLHLKNQDCMKVRDKGIGLVYSEILSKGDE